MRRAVVVIACLLVPAAAQAHQNSVSYLHLEGSGRAVTATVRVEAIDLNEAMGAPPGLELSRADALARAPRVADYLRARLHLTDAGRRCVPSATQTTRTQNRNTTWELVVTVSYECPHTVEALAARYDLFFDVDPKHQGMTTFSAFGRSARHVFVERDRSFSLASGRTLTQQLGEYLRLGVEHIFTGYDHIAFLCGLLLVAGARPLRQGGRDVLAIVTSFTVAHSLTLVGAALGWFTLSPSLVEPAIALSIAYVAVENLFVPAPRRRWALTFGFGLVHGFGFAGVLAEQGLPARAVVASLLSFNAGVELGQLSVVLLALPVLSLFVRPRWTAAPVALATASLGLLYALLAHAGVARGTLALVLFGAVPLLGIGSRSMGYDKGVRRAGSLALGAFALLWFFERVSGRAVLGGALG